MLPETSIARTIVSWADGRVISAAGRDEANSSAASASSSSTGGTWRRQALPRPIASLAPGRGWRSAGVVFLRRRDAARRRAATSTGSGQHRPQHRRPEEGHAGRGCVHGALTRRPARDGRAWAAPTASAPLQLASRLRCFLQVGEAQDGVDQVVVGGELERVDAGARRGASRSSRLAPLGGGREALAKAARCGCRRASARRSRHRASSSGRCRAGPSRAGRTGAPRSPRGAAPAGRAPSPSPAR